MLEFGTVQAIDEKTAQVRVLFPGLENLISPWMPVLHTRGGAKGGSDHSWWMPDVGEQVACMMGEFMESGVVLGSIYSQAAPPPAGSEIREVRFRDGTLVRYDRENKRLDILCEGDITIRAKGNLTLKGSRVDINP